ncbi:FixJ family two-component response regulator [Granulicella aggregans]|uniref:FixJ family two-component response regulator n=1 Tax=Granulicella aggregans TaxID=474949 RepID=A0A7W8E774_9BACT|nr:response regulator [Granulicella aggregans]MBB5061114.1 FixJ family two-component response regulator [Granulicella aggregans]
MSHRPLVTVIDDDESVRESLPDLLNEFGFETAVFRSPEAFLFSGLIPKTECLILDINMPGTSGPDLERELRNQGLAIPIIFITARKDEGQRAIAMAHGAVECLFKPFSDLNLLDALRLVFCNR